MHPDRIETTITEENQHYFRLNQCQVAGRCEEKPRRGRARASRVERKVAAVRRLDSEIEKYAMQLQHVLKR